MAPRLSAMCAGSEVPEMTSVTRSSPSRYLRKNCASCRRNRSPSRGSLRCAPRGTGGRDEGERGQHAGPDLGRERQYALLRLAVVERIVDLHEIRLFPSEHPFDRGEIAVEGGGDADVAAEALRLPRLELRQGLLRIAHVGELQQIPTLAVLRGDERALPARPCRAVLSLCLYEDLVAPGRRAR